LGQSLRFLDVAGWAASRAVLGLRPRSKVSMMNMRPPQQEQGRGGMRGSSAAGASGVLGCSERVSKASNSRALAMLAARRDLFHGREDGLRTKSRCRSVATRGARQSLVLT
jgi:hypothetical protein